MRRIVYSNIVLFFLALSLPWYSFAFEIKDKIRPPTLGFTTEEKILPSDTSFERIGKLLPPQLQLKISDKIPALTATGVVPVLTNPSSPKNSTPEKPKKWKSIEELITLAKADLSERLGIKIEEIFVNNTIERTWSDTSLGCPEKGKYYAQVITPGYLIIFEIGERIYNYHTSLNWVIFCSLSEKTNSVNNSNSEIPKSNEYPTYSLMAAFNLIGENIKTSLGRFFLSNYQ